MAMSLQATELYYAYDPTIKRRVVHFRKGKMLISLVTGHKTKVGVKLPNVMQTTTLFPDEDWFSKVVKRHEA
jgi:hypothetical protein